MESKISKIVKELTNKIVLFKQEVLALEPNKEAFKQYNASSSVINSVIQKYKHFQFRTEFYFKDNLNIKHLCDQSFTTKEGPGRIKLYEKKLTDMTQFLNTKQSAIQIDSDKYKFIVNKQNLSEQQQESLTEIDSCFTKTLREDVSGIVVDTIIRDYSTTFQNCISGKYNTFQQCRDYLWIQMDASGVSEIIYQIVIHKF